MMEYLRGGIGRISGSSRMMESSLRINDDKMLTIRALSLDAAEFDEAPNRLGGLLELQPADPRPNSGTDQG